MMTTKLAQRSIKNGAARISYQAQQGLVLFIALIALVIMSLAAAGLIRSVDTGVLVAGNLAFKQSATISGDTGMVAANNWMRSNGNLLTADSLVNGYYSNIGGAPLALTSTGNWPDNTPAWSATNSAAAIGNGISAGGVEPATGNTIRYVIQRMCRNAGPHNTPPLVHCLFGPASSADGISKVGAGESGFTLTQLTSASPMYRVTARVTGPKNTISYIQAYLF